MTKDKEKKQQYAILEKGFRAEPTEEQRESIVKLASNLMPESRSDEKPVALVFGKDQQGKNIVEVITHKTIEKEFVCEEFETKQVRQYLGLVNGSEQE